MKGEFRVWDNNWKKWRDEEDWYITSDGILMCMRNGKVQPPATPDAFEVYPSTGQTDLNGKQVFKKDIINILCHSKHDYETIVRERAYILWDKEKLTWQCRIFLGKSKGQNCSGYITLSEAILQNVGIEVVGHMNENPELWEVENPK